MDAMVLKTQQYLNTNYGGDSRYEIIEEDGLTGWATIYALTRAFQIELGITATADSFGPTTERLFKERYPNGIKQQADGDETTSRVYAIIQGALWCKGYSTGSWDITEHFYNGTGSGVRELKQDAGYEDPDSTVTLNVMKALLSMNQYVTIYSQGGTSQIRSIQQQLNRKYEEYIGLIPCDGLYGREMCRALILVLQAIEGFSVSDATGNFGEQTKSRCPILPDTQGLLSSHVEEEAIYLIKYALNCNGYSIGVDNAEWTEELTDCISTFQSNLRLNVTGRADLDTWMSLLLSKGNPDRACTACDTRFEITNSRATELRSKGYKVVGRYLTGTTFKVLRDNEPQRILDNGLYFFPIFQESATEVSYFTPEKGKKDANAAVRAARKFRIPEGNVIYFTVDCDPTGPQISSRILPYFQSVYENMDKGYKIGIYGTRNVCSTVCEAGYAETCFVSDMSTGYSGNMGFKMPTNWNYDQFAEIDMDTTADGEWAIDKDAYSERYEPVKTLDSYVYVQPEKPSTEDYPTISEVLPLIEQLEDLYVEWYTPLFQAAPETVPYLSAQVLAAGITNFLRHKRYNDIFWQIALSASDEGFISYVKEKDQNLYNRIEPYLSDDSPIISDENGGLIDFAHLAATAEGYFTHSIFPDAWYGWATDLATAILDTESIANQYSSYQKAADIVVGGAYRFPFEDLCSDADSIKIAELISNSSSTTHSFSEALRTYYSGYATKRFRYYLDDLGCLENLTSIRDSLMDSTRARLSLLVWWLKEKWAELLDQALKDELSRTIYAIENALSYSLAYTSCCNSLANYIYCEIE